MKWFKHITDSLDDPKISDLLDRHGHSGYHVFFGTLEVYAREFKTDDEWILDTSMGYLKRKLRIYHTNHLAIYLQSIADLFKWSVDLENDRVKIYIPKFKELLDESTLKKLRAGEKNSGTVPKKCVTEVDKKENKNKDKKDIKHKHGEYQNVLLTNEEMERLARDYGQDKTEQAIKRLSAYMKETGKSYKEHNLTLRRWVFKAVDEQSAKSKYTGEIK